MGARAFMRHRMAKILPERLSYDYIGRQLRAAPARATRPRTSASRRGSCAWRSISRRNGSSRTALRSGR